MDWKLSGFWDNVQYPISLACAPSSSIPSGPPKVLISIDVVPGKQYTVEAIATAGSETVQTEIFNITIPRGDDSCSSHPRNRSVTVNCRNATVEFGGVGTVSFRCQHMGHDNQPEPCEFEAE